MTKKTLLQTVEVTYVDGSTQTFTDTETNGSLNLCGSQVKEAVEKHRDVTVKDQDGAIFSIICKNILKVKVTNKELKEYVVADLCK